MHQWYILQVYSGNEKKIEKELLAQLAKKGLKDNIEQILIPSEDVIEMKKGKKVSTERKFFPGYMLIRMVMTWRVPARLNLELTHRKGRSAIFLTNKAAHRTTGSTFHIDCLGFDVVCIRDLHYVLQQHNYSSESSDQ